MKKNSRFSLLVSYQCWWISNEKICPMFIVAHLSTIIGILYSNMYIIYICIYLSSWFHSIPKIVFKEIASPQSLLIILLKITRRKYISKYNALSYCYLQQKMRKYTWKKPQTLNQRNKESLQLKKIKINFTLNNFTQMQKMNSEWKKLNSMIQLQF